MGEWYLAISLTRTTMPTAVSPRRVLASRQSAGIRHKLHANPEMAVAAVMPRSVIALLWKSLVTGILALVASQSFGAPQVTGSAFLAGLQSHKEEVDRFLYINRYIDSHSGPDQNLAKQFLAFSENELGLYSEALRDFPMRNELPPKVSLPLSDDWRAVDAVQAIAASAVGRRIVMVNEVHHDAHTRLLTLQLLPVLRKAGFKYFAAEALTKDMGHLLTTGYPTRASGSEYIQEPIYGDILREAVRLGFILIPYEADSSDPEVRDSEQARNIFRKTFAKDPDARVFVHAGYAHIDKIVGRLGNSVRPMAMELAALSGYSPLSIDQSDVREDSPQAELRSLRAASRQVENSRVKFDPAFISLLRTAKKAEVDPYHQIIDRFHPGEPVVLESKAGTYWSARPRAYDMNVVLPLSNKFESNYDLGPIYLENGNERTLVLPPANGGNRPVWLTINGGRRAIGIDAGECRGALPCLVEARYGGEPSDAVSADRYLFLRRGQKSSLFLWPGQYRIEASSVSGETVARTVIVQ